MEKEQRDEALLILDENGDGEIQFEELEENLGALNQLLYSSLENNKPEDGETTYHEANPNFIKG